MIVEFCNLKFLSIQSNVKRVATYSSALYKWLARLSQVSRADRKGQSRMIRAEWSEQIKKATLTKFSVSYSILSTLIIRCRQRRFNLDPRALFPGFGGGAPQRQSQGKCSGKMSVLRLLLLDFILFVQNKNGNFQDSFGDYRCCNINWFHKLTALHYIQNQEYYKCMSPSDSAEDCQRHAKGMNELFGSFS